jgi:hypothetical protein
MSNKQWKPASHEGIIKMFRKFNINFKTDLRARVGFASTTPLGKWVEEVLFPLITTLISCFNNWEDESKRTKEDVSALNGAEKAVMPPYELLVEMLRWNPLVTPEDLLALGMPQRPSGERHPSPVETDPPDCEASSSLLSHLIFHFSPLEKEGERAHKGKPAGQHGGELRYVASETEITRYEELVHSEFSTTSPITIEFDGNLRGRKVYFAMRWENNVGKKGPFGPIMSAIIP